METDRQTAYAGECQSQKHYSKPARGGRRRGAVSLASRITRAMASNLEQNAMVKVEELKQVEQKN